MNRTLVAILLVIAGLAGLFMTACGGFFTVSGLFRLKDPYVSVLFVFGTPSLFAGVAMLWFVKRRYAVWRQVGELLARAEASRAPGPPQDTA